MSEARSSAATGCLRARGHRAVHLWTTAVRVRTAAPNLGSFSKRCAETSVQRLTVVFTAIARQSRSLRRRNRAENIAQLRHSAATLPWSLKRLNVGGGPSRNRTGVQGFAVLCVTTPPPGPEVSLDGGDTRRLCRDLRSAVNPKPIVACLSMKGGWRSANVPI
jgi:hypothetical protein